MSNPKSAANAWHAINKKIVATREAAETNGFVAPVLGADAGIGANVTPKKGASARKTPSKKRGRQVDDDDAEGPGRNRPLRRRRVKGRRVLSLLVRMTGKKMGR